MIWLLLAGCSTTVVFPPARWGTEDTGWRPEATQDIDPWSVAYGCPSGGDFGVEFWTLGPAGDARLDLLGPDDRLELHDVPLVAAEGGRDQHRLGPFAGGVDPEVWVSGEDTTYTCADVPALTWIVRLDDRFGALIDCIAWGDDYDRADVYTATEDILGIGGCRWFASL